MEYLFKASMIVAIFYCCYNLFLQRDTFFQSNRWFFIIGLITAILIPLAVIPIYITVQPQEFIYSVSNLTSSSETIVTPFNWNGVIIAIYFLGVSILAVRLLIQIYSLVSLIIRNKKQRSGKFIYVEVEDNISPFSFFNWIVFNPNQFKQTELEQIITHEKVHANQFHSIDILLVQIVSVVFWCNPLIWLYKKELNQNLEFIADKETQKLSSCEKSYQHLLLKTSMPNYQMALTNNFYNSLIKKRIIMLHKNRSQNRNYWKFVLILPLLALFIMSFNTKEIYIEKELSTSNLSEAINSSTIDDIVPLIDNVIKKEQKNSSNQKAKNNKQNVIKTEFVTSKTVEVIITKDYSEADFNKIKKEFEDAGFTLKFKGIKRNDNGEITAIKIDARSEKSNANFNTNSDDPIKPIKITIDNENNSISIGNGSEHHIVKGEGFSFISKEGNHKIHTSGKGNNVFVHESDDDHDDDDEHENVFVVKRNGKVHEVMDIHKNKKVHVIRGDDDSILEIKGDDGTLIEIKGKHEDGKVIINGNSVVWNHDDKNIWTTDKDKKITIESLVKGNNKIFISGDSDKEPLFFLDGKEVSKKVIDELDSDTIDKVEVLKGDGATKEYGEKAKDGVILITTKKKKD